MTIRTDLSPAFRPISTGSGPVAPAPQAPVNIDALITKAVDGTLTPAEASTLQQMLDLPELKDKFTPEQRSDLQKFAQGRELPPRSASELTGDLSKVTDPKDLPGRFASDLAVQRDALLEHLSLLRADKATRLFEFAVPYAKALAELAQNPAQLGALASKLVTQAEKAGFGALQQQPNQETGVEVLKALLKTGSAEEIAKLATGLRFDAPIWPKDPIRQSEYQRPTAEKEHLQPVAPGGKAEVMRPLPPVMQPPVPVQQRVDEPEAKRKNDGTNKRLSPMLLWNALHTLRDAGEGEQDSAAQREALTQLAVGAALILGFMAIIVGVLVAL